MSMRKRDRKRFKPLARKLSRAISKDVRNGQYIPQILSLLRQNGFPVKLTLEFTLLVDTENITSGPVRSAEEVALAEAFDTDFLAGLKIKM